MDDSQSSYTGSDSSAETASSSSKRSLLSSAGSILETLLESLAALPLIGKLVFSFVAKRRLKKAEEFAQQHSSATALTADEYHSLHRTKTIKLIENGSIYTHAGVSRSPFTGTAVAFLFLYTLGGLLTLFRMIPQQQPARWYSFWTGIITVLLYFLLMFSDPGRLPQAPHECLGDLTRGENSAVEGWEQHRRRRKDSTSPEHTGAPPSDMLQPLRLTADPAENTLARHSTHDTAHTELYSTAPLFNSTRTHSTDEPRGFRALFAELARQIGDALVQFHRRTYLAMQRHPRPVFHAYSFLLVLVSLPVVLVSLVRRYLLHPRTALLPLRYALGSHSAAPSTCPAPTHAGRAKYVPFNLTALPGPFPLHTNEGKRHKHAERAHTEESMLGYTPPQWFDIRECDNLQAYYNDVCAAVSYYLVI